MFIGTIADIELSFLTCDPYIFCSYNAKKYPRFLKLINSEDISITNPTFLSSVRLRNVKIHVKIKSVKLVKSLENKNIKFTNSVK